MTTFVLNVGRSRKVRKLTSLSYFTHCFHLTFSVHLKVGDKPTNWAELPPELISSILLRLDAVDILENVQKVCKPWQRVTKDPSIWRKIDMQNTGSWGLRDHELEKMCRNAIDRSEGGLVEIKIRNFGTVELINYIAERSSNLRSFGFAMHYEMREEGLVNAVAKLPLLEELKVTNMGSNMVLKAIGHSCSRLKTLKLNCSGYWRYNLDYDDRDALTIAESMPELRHLQLLGNGLSDVGLSAILDNCPHLEHLDLRMCFNVRNLENRCLERIKDLRRPNDSTADYPFGITFLDAVSDSDDDWAYMDHDDLRLAIPLNSAGLFKLRGKSFVTCELVHVLSYLCSEFQCIFISESVIVTR